jgi:hypothetical protein
VNSASIFHRVRKHSTEALASQPAGTYKRTSGDDFAHLIPQPSETALRINFNHFAALHTPE